MKHKHVIQMDDIQMDTNGYKWATYKLMKHKHVEHGCSELPMARVHNTHEFTQHTNG